MAKHNLSVSFSERLLQDCLLGWLGPRARNVNPGPLVFTFRGGRGADHLFSFGGTPPPPRFTFLGVGLVCSRRRSLSHSRLALH